MSLPFDATLKDFVQAYPADFETHLHVTGPGPSVVLNVDLSTISAATDVVLGHGDPLVEIIDLNFQASRDDKLSARVLVYNALLYHRFQVPFHSLIVLLRPEANDPALLGKLSYRTPRPRGKLDFRYDVLRLWKIPPRRFLKGGLGTLPLAVLGKLPKQVSVTEALARVVAQIDDRLEHDAPPAEAGKIMTAAFVLSGLRITKEEAFQLFRGAKAMQESTTYQAILEEGQIKEAKKMLLIFGTDAFGPPSESVKQQLAEITDLKHLEALAKSIRKSSSWQKLFEGP
jgi:predicted transposase YdaD